MTPTPDNEAGRLTEQVMAGFKNACGQEMPTAAYNRMYEHVYRVLSAEIPKLVQTHGRAVCRFMADGLLP